MVGDQRPTTSRAVVVFIRGQDLSIEGPGLQVEIVGLIEVHATARLLHLPLVRNVVQVVLVEDHLLYFFFGQKRGEEVGALHV